MSEPDTSRDLPQALRSKRGLIVLAWAAQPEPEESRRQGHDYLE